MKIIPQAEGHNSETEHLELYELPYFYWSGLAHMAWDSKLEQSMMIEVLEYVLSGGFNIR